MTNRFSVLALVIIVLGLLVVGSAYLSPTGNVSVDVPELLDEDPATETQEISIDIVIGDFEPDEITVRKGVPVKLTLTNKEIDEQFHVHGFAIKELGIDETVDAGETSVVEFTPDKTGSFVFYCSVFCGQGHTGQTGILHVIE